MTMEKEAFYRHARNDLAGPLEGVKVLELTTTWAGPMAGCLLGDYGADVIKIEQPEGEIIRRIQPPIPGTDGSPLLNEVVNRNKRNVTLNLREAEGRELALKLVEQVDLVVENFRPGTLAAWGLGYADAQRVKPDILAKGGDYAIDEVDGRAFVEGYGGAVHVLAHRAGLGSTEIIRKLEEV